MSNLNQDDLTREIYKDFNVSPQLYRSMDLVCLILWCVTAIWCAKLVIKPVLPFDFLVGAVCFVLAAGFQLYYLWAKRTGLIEKVRKKE